MHGKYSSNSPDRRELPMHPAGRLSGGGNHKRKKVHIRRKKRDCYEEVKEVVQAKIREWVVKSKTKDDPFEVHHFMPRVTKEGLAIKLEAYEKDVHKALMRLNREGLVYQRANVAPHNARAGWMWYGHDESAWQASTYKIRIPGFEPDKMETNNSSRIV
jgi:hypothetical protein